MDKLTVYLNNGDKLSLDRPARGKNIDTLARQISECDLVHSVDTGGLHPDENVRYEGGKSIGFVDDLT